MIDWKQKLKNQWVQIEISRVQPGKPGNFLPLGPFPFQYSSDYSEKKKKIPFDFNTENVVLQIIFQMNVLLRGLYTWKSFKN